MSHSDKDLLSVARVLIKDDVVMRTALQRDPSLYRYASETLRSDRRVTLDVVTDFGEQVEHAPEGLRDDDVIIRAAMVSYFHAIQYASDRLKADREFILFAVGRNGSNLQYA